MLVNIVIPAVILMKLSKPEYLGPVNGLLIALAFPLVYGLYELIVQKQKNFISALGFVGVLLTGLIGIFHFPPHWIAVKEAAIPFIIGVVVLISTKTSWQLVRKMIYNPELLDIEKIEAVLDETNSKSELNRMLTKANVWFAFSFFVSSFLNYVLAKVIVVSNPGTDAFNEELGRMTMLSFPIIALPSTIIMMLVLWYIFASLKKVTQLNMNEILADKLKS